MTAPHAKIIVNPTAGTNSTRRKWPRINRQLVATGLLFDYQYTEGVGHAAEIAREAACDGYRYLVAVGGDGTVNEVANGMLSSADTCTSVLGVVSTGTGNDFTRSMGIPRHYAKACNTLIDGRTSLIDVGVVEYRNKGEIKQRFFTNSAGIGFDAATVQTTERMPRFINGKIPYIAGLLRTLVSYQNKSVTLNVDGQTETTRILSIVVANGGYFGGGMHVAPDADFTDNKLDLVVVGDIGKLDLLRSLPMIYRGTHGRHPKVSIGRASRITVESSEPFLVQADGEFLGEGPASFWLMPAVLNVVV